MNPRDTAVARVTARQLCLDRIARVGVPLDDVTRDALLRRIGVEVLPAADADGLRRVHRAFVGAIPYEDLTVQLGESAPLDRDDLVGRMLRGGRGGYCFEANTVLHAILETLGFAVQRREGIVGRREAHHDGDLTNHMALVVHTADQGCFIAEAGLGEGPLDPLPLAEGTFAAGAFELSLARDDGGWWVQQHPFGSIPGFWFSDAPADLADFQPHHRRLSSAADSSFVQTLVVQRPFDDHIVTLRARTLFLDGPRSRERRVLADAAAFAGALQHQFGIDPHALGLERLERLWIKACEQHARRREQQTESGAALS
jgi:N-hydroxyarylamine O-acetyltransferase